MEIHNCLQEIIGRVIEKNRIDQLVRARDVDGNLIIIDLDELKSLKRLEGAIVFKTLFGINKESKFGKFKMQEDEFGCITLFSEFGIRNNSWYLLMFFLRNGIVVKNLEDNNKFLIKLQDINNTCNKLGGIPSYDKYYLEQIYNFQSKINKEYNPLKPDDDIYNKYHWSFLVNRYAHDQSNFEINHKFQDGWTVTCVTKLSGNPCLWYRKIK